MAILEGVRRQIGQRFLRPELREWGKEFGQTTASLDYFQERMAELELALEDVGWMKMGLESNREFSREGLKHITQLARMMYLKNPLIKRGVEVKKFYVWGQGVNIQARHPEVNDVVQAFLNEERNLPAIWDGEARKAKEVELQTDGNVFFVFFPNISTGKVRVRTIPFDEIEDVICNPEDSIEPWYYKRVWTERLFRPGMGTGSMGTKRRVAWYPDWKYIPKQKSITTMDGHPIHWDNPIYHLKVGGFSNWRFGISEIYAGLDWAKAYKEFLEDVATIMRALSVFAWKQKTKGGKRGLAAAKTRLGTTLGDGGGGLPESNPPPVKGAMWLGSEGADLNPLNVRGSSVNPEDGRRLLLMVAASVGLPETFFGDVSTGTLATAKSLDRPTELMMRDRQQMWADVYRRMLDYVVYWSVKAPSGPLHSLGRINKESDGDQLSEWVEWRQDSEGKDVDATIDVDFPPLIEEDVAGRVKAIVSAATLDGVQPAGTIPDRELAKMLLIALGTNDVDEVLEDLFPEGEGDFPAVAQAAKEVREALDKFAEKWRSDNSSEVRSPKSKKRVNGK